MRDSIDLKVVFMTVNSFNVVTRNILVGVIEIDPTQPLWGGRVPFCTQITALTEANCHRSVTRLLGICGTWVGTG